MPPLEAQSEVRQIKGMIAELGVNQQLFIQKLVDPFMSPFELDRHLARLEADMRTINSRTFSLSRELEPV